MGSNPAVSSPINCKNWDCFVFLFCFVLCGLGIMKWASLFVVIFLSFGALSYALSSEEV